VIPLDEARAHVFAACTPLAPVVRTVRAALGLVTAGPVTAAEDVPPFDNSAVDGFAVVAADTTGGSVELAVVGTLAAGAAPGIDVSPGRTVRIMTGAPIPPGADAIVMVEDSEALDDGHRVRLTRAVQAGDAVRRAGSDVRTGDLVLAAGVVLHPAHLGVLASIGRLELDVVPAVRVGVLSTGDELVDDGSPLRPGQIRESNRTMLAAALAQAGCDVIDLGVVRDDEATLERVLRAAALRCDALVTSGGVSMGDFDIVKAVLSRVADMRWMQIAIRPAKPFAFGTLDGGGARRVPVFGLPGNPVSSLVSFELIARPALRQMMGHRQPDRTRVLAVADDALSRRPDGKTHWTRVHGAFGPDGRFHVRSSGEQGSHQLAATAAANALAEVVDGTGIAAGGDVSVLLLD
jgi:molybdenum cofactor synthesis domain-containing protein